MIDVLVQMKPEIYMTIAGSVISLLFLYFPGIRTWFAALQDNAKQGIMLGLGALTAVAIFVLGCFAIIGMSVACTQTDAVRLAFDFILWIVANQGTFSGFKRLAPADVKAIKAVKADPMVIARPFH